MIFAEEAITKGIIYADADVETNHNQVSCDGEIIKSLPLYLIK